MTESVARVGDVLRVGPRWAWLIAVVGLCALTVLAGQATRLDMLPTALGVVLAILVTLVSLRWPLLPLILFVALIPIEELVVVGGFGTISKFAGILFAVTYRVPRLGHLTLRAMPPAAWAYLVWVILSLGWALDPNTAFGQIPTLVQLFVIAVLVADLVVQRPAVVRSLLWVYSLSAAITAVVAIQYFFTLGPSAGERAFAIPGQGPAQFAAILLPAWVFAVHQFLEGDRRIIAGIVTLLTTAGLLVSGTRGAWVGAVVVVVLFILPRLSLRRQVVAIAMIVVIGFVSLQIPGVANLLLERTGNAVSSGGAGRTDIWSVGITLFRSAPIAGVGYANFPVADTLAAIRAADVNARHLGAGPHNVVIGTLVELGLLGFLLLLAFLLPLVLRRGWGPDAAAVQAALASLLVAALFLDILSDRKQVWLLIGLAAGLTYIRRKRTMSPSDEELAPSVVGAGTNDDRGKRLPGLVGSSAPQPRA